MNIREAVGRIIGQELADDIIADQGMHWAVIAAMTEARTPRHDRECAVIRAWRAEQKSLSDVLADVLQKAAVQ